MVDRSKRGECGWEDSEACQFQMASIDPAEETENLRYKQVPYKCKH